MVVLTCYFMDLCCCSCCKTESCPCFTRVCGLFQTTCLSLSAYAL